MSDNLDGLLKLIPRELTEQERDLIGRAFEFAKTAHEGQKRASGAPYFTHCYATAQTLATMEMDAETIASGLLHDVVDDTPITVEEIEKEFGKSVAFLVGGVTKLGKLKYRGMERHVENLRKMFVAMAEDIRVIIIKLADRLHNMQTLEHLPPDKQKRIATETLEIYAPIADRLGIGEIKGALEDLAFEYVYPEEYEWVVKNSAPIYKDLKGYLHRLEPTIVDLLKKEGVDVISINTRTKHYYSLYKKLERKEMDWKRIYDIAALRIIVKDVSDCYKTLGVIHKTWKPIMKELNDYIAMPKPNGYQSLQTAVFCDQGRIAEVQIRTPQMHEEAEHGVAAHWAYSAQGKPTGGSTEDRKLAWIKDLREWQKEIEGSEELLESLKIDVFKNRIFAYTPAGDVIDLPEGATPVDFAYEIHSDIGDHCAGARVGSKMVPLDTPLKNGDIVEIITQKNKRPNKNWLDFVKTGDAKTRIKAALKREK